MHRHCLPTALGLLNIQFHPGAIRNRTLPKVPKNIGMKQNIRAAFIGNYKPKPFNRVKPLNTPLYSANIIILCRHFFLPNSLHPQDCITLALYSPPLASG
ncbi:hypothetical protein RV420_400343 [Roseovarius sp. EC-SD190]|nr:hypothetical protein RV420_400343 [Roseovarius sp. EC-SD190]